MPRLAPDDLLDVAERYHDLSVRVGRYRFAHWNELSTAERSSLESLEWSLMNASTDFIARGITLRAGDVEGAVARIRSATAALRRAVRGVSSAKKVIAAATAAVTLAGAITSGNVPAILDAVGDAMRL
ncbi:MAG: hypothetical protein ACREON_05350 [Gemmatimonadaceae bacterium]